MLQFDAPWARHLAISLCFALVTFLLAACGAKDATGPGTVARIVVTPGAVSLTALGDTTRLVASTLDANGNAVSGNTVAWTTSNANVATVNASGLVTARGNGSAAITAPLGTISAAASVTVAQEVATVSVSPPTVVLAALGETRLLVATAADANGNEVPGVSFQWSTSDPTVASVDSNGEVTAERNGTATVTATVGSTSGEAVVEVDQVATQIGFVSQPSSVAAGETITPAIGVEIRDARDSRVAHATATVDLAIETNPSGGQLSGTKSVTAISGLATFDDLTIDRSGAGYVLRAAAGALGTALGAPIDVTPRPVTLAAPTKSTNAVELSWSQSSDPDFASYTVLRVLIASGVEQTVGILADPAVTTFEDSSATLGQTYEYRVQVQTAQGLSSESNRHSISAGVFIDVGTEIEKMIPDPSRPRFYAISKNTSRILVIDAVTNQVTTEFTVDASPTDLDIDLSGDTLFVISFPANKIAVFDLDGLSLVKTISFADPLNHSQSLHYHVEAGRAGRVYFVDGKWAPEIHIIDTHTEAQVGQFSFDGVGDIEASPDGNDLFVWRQFGWGAGNIFSWVRRIDASTDALSQEQIGTTQIGRDPLDTPILLTASGTTVFVKAWSFLSGDLAIVEAALPDPVYAIRPDGSLAFTENDIVNGAQGVAIQPIPLRSRVLALSADGATLFIYKSGAGQIFLYDLTPF
jgi:uncharacterized protein YjdB